MCGRDAVHHRRCHHGLWPRVLLNMLISSPMLQYLKWNYLHLGGYMLFASLLASCDPAARSKLTDAPARPPSGRVLASWGGSREWEPARGELVLEAGPAGAALRPWGPVGVAGALAQSCVTLGSARPPRCTLSVVSVSRRGCHVAWSTGPAWGATRVLVEPVPPDLPPFLLWVSGTSVFGQTHKLSQSRVFRPSGARCSLLGIVGT